MRPYLVNTVQTFQNFSDDQNQGLRIINNFLYSLSRGEFEGCLSNDIFRYFGILINENICKKFRPIQIEHLKAINNSLNIHCKNVVSYFPIFLQNKNRQFCRDYLLNNINLIHLSIMDRNSNINIFKMLSTYNGEGFIYSKASLDSLMPDQNYNLNTLNKLYFDNFAFFGSQIHEDKFELKRESEKSKGGATEDLRQENLGGGTEDFLNGITDSEFSSLGSLKISESLARSSENETSMSEDRDQKSLRSEGFVSQPIEPPSSLCDLSASFLDLSDRSSERSFSEHTEKRFYVPTVDGMGRNLILDSSNGNKEIIDPSSCKEADGLVVHFETPSPSPNSSEDEAFGSSRSVVSSQKKTFKIGK